MGYTQILLQGMNKNQTYDLNVREVSSQYITKCQLELFAVEILLLKLLSHWMDMMDIIWKSTEASRKYKEFQENLFKKNEYP